MNESLGGPSLQLMGVVLSEAPSPSDLELVRPLRAAGRAVTCVHPAHPPWLGRTSEFDNLFLNPYLSQNFSVLCSSCWISQDQPLKHGSC